MPPGTRRRTAGPPRTARRRRRGGPTRAEGRRHGWRRAGRPPPRRCGTSRGRPGRGRRGRSWWRLRPAGGRVVRTPAAAVPGDEVRRLAERDLPGRSRVGEHQPGARGKEDAGPAGRGRAVVVAQPLDRLARLRLGAALAGIEAERGGTGRVGTLGDVEVAADRDGRAGRQGGRQGFGEAEDTAGDVAGPAAGQEPCRRVERLHRADRGGLLRRPVDDRGEVGGPARQAPPGFAFLAPLDGQVAQAGAVARRHPDRQRVQVGSAVTGRERDALPVARRRPAGGAHDRGVVVAGEELAVGASEVQHDVSGGAVQQTRPVGRTCEGQ